MGYDIREIEGIGPTYAERLDEVGIADTDDLFAKGWMSSDRKRVANKTGISTRLLLRWVNQANLMRVNGIGGEYANLLYRVGIPTLLRLAEEEAMAIKKAFDAYLEIKPNVVRRTPPLDEVAGWVNQAKGLVEQLDLPEEILVDYTDIRKMEELRLVVEDAIESHDWSELTKAGNLLRGQAFFNLLGLRERISIVLDVAPYQIPPGIAEQLRQLSTIENPRKSLETESGQEIEGYLDDLVTGEGQTRKAVAGEPYVDYLQERIEYVVFIGALGFYLTLVGRLNGRDAGSVEEGLILQASDAETHVVEDMAALRSRLLKHSYAQIEERLQVLEDIVRQIPQTIYGALISDQLDVLEEKALAGLSRLEMAVEGLRQAVVLSDMLAVSDSFKTPEEMKSRIHTSRLVEWLVALYGLCLYYVAVNNRSPTNPLLARELERVRRLKFESNLPTGQTETISELLAKPEEYAGIRLEIVGEMVRLWDRKNRIKTFALKESGEGAGETNILPLVFTDLKSEGFLPPNGAACLAFGRLVDSRDQPALEVKNLNFSQLAKRSWFDRMINLAQKWYDLFPEDVYVLTDEAIRDTDRLLKVIDRYLKRSV